MPKNILKKIIVGMIALLVVSAVCTSELFSGDLVEPVYHPKVMFEMADGGQMVFELYPEYAPETVENFVNLVKSGFYDGTKFHRILKGSYIAGGDSDGDGFTNSDKTIKGEFAANGFTKNKLKHTRGVISMLRGAEYDSATTMFFIVDGEKPNYDGYAAAFGRLVEGMETLDRISNTPVGPFAPVRGEYSVPLKDVIIKKAVLLE